jgi:hypothetical protein
MAGHDETSQLNWPHRWHVLLALGLGLLIALRLFSLADDAANRAGLVGEMTHVGGRFAPDPRSPRYFWRVMAVDPGGALDRAGVRVGDSIRPQPRLVRYVRHAAGERVPFYLDRRGQRLHGEIIMQPVRQTLAEQRSNVWAVLNRLGAMLTTLIGGFILWRGWGNRTAMLLGAGMLPLYVVVTTIPPLFGTPIASTVYFALANVTYAFVHLLPLFAMRMHAETARPLSPRSRKAVRLFVATALLQQLIAVGALVFGFALPTPFTTAVGFLFAQLGPMLSIVVLISAWRNSEGMQRNRIAVTLFSILAYVIAALASFAMLDFNFFFANRAAFGAILVFNLLMAGLIAPTLLAYAVLRHKLFDLGFAVNRTLVYGGVSVLLLASFALIEWAIKSMIPKAWYGGSAYFSAAIAVGLFLLFHRIHHFVEHGVERLFFHKWQLNEAALKRFVAAAAHVEKPEALAGHYERELARFSGGASASLYTRTGRGTYASAAGDAIDADDPALSAIRAEQGAVVPAELGSAANAALALPMMHQAALAGFVLLGSKPSGEDYRPDEIAILGWATQQVGLDLQAIRVRDLEQQVITLSARNANLSEILAKAALAEE